MKPFYSYIILVLILILTETLITPSSAANSTAERCHPDDKQALLRIKQQSFAKSNQFDSWDPNTDCCNGWSFVQCDTSNNRINSFVMLGSDTGGTPFPSAVGDLPYLDTIIFHNNATGPIPTSLSKLRRITSLFIGINRLTGPIPSFFHTLPILSTLDLSQNRLSGPIPPSLALSPSLGNLILRDNRLTGQIPDSFGSFKDDKFDLDVANNMLSGELPKSLGNVKIFHIDVSGNKFVGDASFLFGKKKTVVDIILNNNAFSFDMTNLEIPPLLNILRISHNKIFGSLPKELGNLTQLVEIDVSFNQLCGMIPTGGADLAQYGAASFSNNKCLCGAPLSPCK